MHIHERPEWVWLSDGKKKRKPTSHKLQNASFPKYISVRLWAICTEIHEELVFSCHGLSVRLSRGLLCKYKDKYEAERAGWVMTGWLWLSQQIPACTQALIPGEVTCQWRANLYTITIIQTSRRTVGVEHPRERRRGEEKSRAILCSATCLMFYLKLLSQKRWNVNKKEDKRYSSSVIILRVHTYTYLNIIIYSPHSDLHSN